jgi:hypothetical protein
MFDQLLESFRKASESSLRAQQEMFKQWAQQWPLTAPAIPTEWSETVQKRCLESMTETLNKQREVLDSTYKSGLHIIEQAFRISDAKSPEDYRRLLEDLWHKLTVTIKEQSEVQFQELQKATERWLEMAQAVKPGVR